MSIAAGYWLVRAGRAGRSDLAARVPELSGLQDRTVLIIGTGAVGSAVADQLARAGVGNLHLIDRDVLEPGNAVRHAAPFLSSGLHKPVATAQQAAGRSPYVAVHMTALPLGSPRADGAEQDHMELLDQAVADADLVVDATAELGLQLLFADVARAAGTTYMAATATNGAWGGMVLRVRAGSDGCYRCALHAFDDRSLPLPPAAPSELVQPPGCASPTFTGSGFDVDEIALQAVRTATGELAADEAYPVTGADVAILSLRTADGEVQLPAWTGHPLLRHPACPAH